jgi:hypothetical protein
LEKNCDGYINHFLSVGLQRFRHSFYLAACIQMSADYCAIFERFFYLRGKECVCLIDIAEASDKNDFVMVKLSIDAM